MAKQWEFTVPGAALEELPQLVYELIPEFQQGPQPDVAALLEHVSELRMHLCLLVSAGELALMGDMSTLRDELDGARRALGERRRD